MVSQPSTPDRSRPTISQLIMTATARIYQMIAKTAERAERRQGSFVAVRDESDLSEAWGLGCMNFQRAGSPSGPSATTGGAPMLQMAPELLQAWPMAAYACTQDGRVLWFNERASELWGRRPRLDDPTELYCGSHKVFLNDRQLSRD